MPLSKLESLGPGRAWGLWLIDETEGDLSFLSFETCPDDVVHPQKRLEWLAGRALVRTLVEHVNLPYEGIRKDEFGKPFLKSHPHSISLSHSFPFVAAQIDSTHPVGIDLEQAKEKLKQVGPRVMAPEEVSDANGDVVKLCVYWCAKEALYKIYGRRNLLFSDHIRVRPFKLSGEGVLTGQIQVKPEVLTIQLGYRITNDYVLVFTDAVK